MYRVTVRTGGKEYLLHDPRDDEIQLINPELVEEIGKNGTFTFTISPTHPNKDKIIPMASEIMLWKDREMFFCCRMLDSENDFYNTGRATCEGELAFLLDSMQRPYEFTGSVYELFTQLLDTHNSQVEERKRFLAGHITVAGEQIVRSNPDYTNTMNEMLSQLQNRSGGYLRVRYANGKKYLDYVNDYGGINKQVIRFGENLIDLTKHIDPMNVITVLVPIGATIESEDSAEEPKTVNISSVNGGKDYIIHEAAVSRYGQIWGSKKFEDVTDPEALLAKAKVYLEECVEIPETIELRAIDLSLISVDIEPMKVGYWTNVISKPHSLNHRMMLSKKTLSLVDPTKNNITLGQVRRTFTGETAKKDAEISSRINSVAANASKEINRKVENATQLITGGKGGYVVLDVDDPDTGKRELPWRILIMDTPDKETATSVIQLNKNGIGFSTTGINGPYRNAWTIDGNLVADFITTGQMLADRIRGGILEVGGDGLARDGSIIVKDATGKVIGTWNKTGLHVYLGIIEGSTIKGSSIIGGRINIGNGTFEVDSDGAVIINSGEIHIGNVDITEQYAWLYGFGVSDTVLYSRDSGTSVQIITKDDEYGNGPAVELKKGSSLTRIGYGGVVTGDISFNDSWTEGMTAIDMFKDLYNRTNSLRQRIEDLEG